MLIQPSPQPQPQPQRQRLRPQAFELGWEKAEAFNQAVAHTGRVLLRTKLLDHAVEAAEGLSASNLTLQTGLGVANLALGAVDLAQGRQALQQGKNLQAALNLGGGLANLVSGAALLGEVACPGVCSANGLGAAASGVGALLDGVDDLLDHHRVSGTLKMAGGACLLAGSLSGMPQLSAAGSLVYLSGMGAQHGPELQDWIKSVQKDSRAS